MSHPQPPYPAPVNYLSFLECVLFWIELLTACQEDCGLSPEDRFSEGGSVSLDLSLTYRSLNQLCCVVVLVSLVEFRVKQLSLAGEEQLQAHLVT